MDPQHPPFSSLPSHVTPSATMASGNDTGSAAKRSWLTKVLLAIAGVIIVGTIVFLVLLLRYKPATPTTSNTNLSDIKTSDLAKIAVQGNSIGAGNETLKIAGNTEIVGSAEFDKDVTVKGTLNLSGPFAPSSLNVSGATLLQSGLTVSKFVNLTGNLNVSGTTTFSGAVTADSLSVSKLANIGDLTFGKHLISSGPTPTIDTFNGNSGSISGSDATGTVSVDAANLTLGQLVRVNFKTAYTSTPRVSLTPTSINSANVLYYVSKSPGNFTIVVISFGNGTTGDYSFDYLVTQ